MFLLVDYYSSMLLLPYCYFYNPYLVENLYVLFPTVQHLQYFQSMAKGNKIY